MRWRGVSSGLARQSLELLRDGAWFLVFEGLNRAAFGVERG